MASHQFVERDQFLKIRLLVNVEVRATDDWLFSMKMTDLRKYVRLFSLLVSGPDLVRELTGIHWKGKISFIFTFAEQRLFYIISYSCEAYMQHKPVLESGFNQQCVFNCVIYFC